MDLNMYADFTFKIPFEERLALIKNAGFDGVMLGFSEGLMYTQYDIVRKFGLKIENVHSPFDRMNALWEICPVSDYIFGRTAECIEVCGKNGVGTVIVHPTDGVVPPKISKFGLKNFEKLITLAERYGVDIAFENIQLPEFLDIIFDNYGKSPRVKFCYDVGHENCFSKGTDCLGKFGDRLCAVHVHDNDGISDGHMIPYDGNIDFDVFLKKLISSDYDGAMSLELYMSKSSEYAEVTPEAFVCAAAKAGRFLVEKYKVLGGML